MLLEDKFYYIVNRLAEMQKTISTMESCTGGFIASMITDIPGSSEVIKGAFVTYSNEAKIMQGVPEWIINEYGVYSLDTASAMAQACKKAYNADIGIGITGCFSNLDKNNNDSRPDVVYIAIKFNNRVITYQCTFGPYGERHEYKVAVANFIADELLDIVYDKL